jgi:ribosomal protein S18 acetylase RimI-like enzyme
VTLRVPTEADVPEILRLLAEDWPEPPSPDSVRRLWTTPGFDRELDARLEEGACAAVVDLGNGSVWIDLRGRPSPALFDWAEARARERSSRVLSGGWSSNETLLRELERRGFELVRHSQRMQIDLSEPPPAPVWPDGLEARTFRPGDERVVHAVQHEAFEDSWEPANAPFEEWEHWFLGSSPRFAPDLWFLALDGDEPAGVAICHPHPGDPTLGWVGELGVLRPWRRRGLGRALLLQAFAAFRERGLQRAALGVDAESLTGANRLYESAGMHVAARFDIYEKPAA